MPTIVKFEDIQAWQEARVLTREIYSLTWSGSFAKDFGLRDQITRAAVYIMNNIAEGFDRNQGPSEFRRFLAMAKGSAGEVKSLLYVALDLSYVSEADFTATAKQVDAVSRLTGAFMCYLRESSRAVRKRANS